MESAVRAERALENPGERGGDLDRGRAGLGEQPPAAGADQKSWADIAPGGYGRLQGFGPYVRSTWASSRGPKTRMVLKSPRTLTR